jgi:A/G-specific adenine glycosylase
MTAPFTDDLLQWYDRHKAPLPWRTQSDPYRVWLSEIMLQQTQVDTVIPYYTRFLARFPTVDDLAEAPLADVLKAWEGLGYYSRARNLHQTAHRVARDLGGCFPNSAEGLIALPGIGRYTAGAIASIAFGEQAALLDGNVIRVFARLLDLPDDVTQTATKNQLWSVAEAWVPEERPGDYNQALMELGRTVCTPRAPQCDACPIAAHCRARANGTQAERPVKKKRAPAPHYDVTAGLIRDTDGRLLIAQRPPDGLLGGLWEFPGGKREDGESLEACLARELDEELAIRVDVGALFVVVKHAFTHFKITLHAFECVYVAGPPQKLGVADFAWVTEAELDGYSFGKADRQVIAALRARGGMLL